MFAGIGLCALGSTRSSSCLAAEVHFNWCRLVGGILLADADLCLLGLGSGIGLNSVVKLLGGRGAFFFFGVVWLVASCWQMLICVCWDWALALGLTRSSSCLATEVQNRQAAWRKKFSCWLAAGFVVIIVSSSCLVALGGVELLGIVRVLAVCSRP